MLSGAMSGRLDDDYLADLQDDIGSDGDDAVSDTDDDGFEN